MALYLGSSEINPVISTIKEVPTEQDLTLMGNELRRAYAYTNVQDGSGKSQILIQNGSSIPYKSTELYNNLECFNNSVVIDGKAYQTSISNNQVLLTQIGTDTDWDILLNYNGTAGYMMCGIKNHKLYSSTSYLTNTLNSWITQSGKPNGSGSVIVDGAIYYTGYRSSEAYLIDDTGTWTSIAREHRPVVGIRNEYYTAIHSTYGMTIFNDFKFKDDWYIIDSDGSTLVINDNLDVYYIKYNNGTFTSTKKTTLSKIPKKLIAVPNISSGPYGYIILNNDNTLDFYSSSFVLKRTEENCKNIIITSITPSYYLLKTNGDLYYLTITSLGAISLTLLENIGNNAQLFSHFTKYMNGTPGALKITYYDTNPVYSTLYVPSTIGTNAYITTTSLSSKTITTTTNNSIIVEGREYFRDTSKDSTFNFVPPELANHTFTDQELCQAYLSAGINQQQNNNT